MRDKSLYRVCPFGNVFNDLPAVSDENCIAYNVNAKNVTLSFENCDLEKYFTCVV